MRTYIPYILVTLFVILVSVLVLLAVLPNVHFTSDSDPCSLSVTYAALARMNPTYSTLNYYYASLCNAKR